LRNQGLGKRWLTSNSQEMGDKNKKKRRKKQEQGENQQKNVFYRGTQFF